MFVFIPTKLMAYMFGRALINAGLMKGSSSVFSVHEDLPIIEAKTL